MDSMGPDDVTISPLQSTCPSAKPVSKYSCFSLCLILIPIVMTETRSAVLLMRIARKKRKETGDERYRARCEDERPSLKSLLYISCTRPIRECTDLFTFHPFYLTVRSSLVVYRTTCLELQCKVLVFSIFDSGINNVIAVMGWVGMGRILLHDLVRFIPVRRRFVSCFLTSVRPTS